MTKILNFNKNSTAKLLTLRDKKEYKGVKNKTKFKEFIYICKRTQNELKAILPERLTQLGYENVVTADGYIYAKGTVPVCLIAHMDTVHVNRIVDYYEWVDEKGNHILSSPQGIGGDDRCGIYMILQIIKTHKCSVIFCEDEECGGIGARKFSTSQFIEELKEMKYLIEFDRKNNNDAVFYRCANKEFENFITTNTGLVKGFGSFSDISVIAPACKVAAVNISCGYHSPHSTDEEVNVEEMMRIVGIVKNLIPIECEQFEYKELTYDRTENYSRQGYGYGYGYCGYDYLEDYYNRRYGLNKLLEDEDDSYVPSTKQSKKSSGKQKEVLLFVTFESYDHQVGDFIQEQKLYTGKDKFEAWFEFFDNNPDISMNMVVDYEFDEV